jgi:hypothetical protein
MATTTNYGWDTPDDTDLVKDGAAAIRTLGSSVDTTTKNLNPQTTTGALAYRSATANVNTALPIGTAGQILAVSGGVPAWINNDQGDITEVQAGVGISVASGTGPIPVITNSSTDLITTAGDLLYGTAADTVARLGIGTVGQVLAVNSGATAPEWVTPAGALTVASIASGTLSGASLSVTSLSAYDDIWFFAKNITGSASLSIGFRINSNATSPNYKTWQAYEINTTGYPINYVHNTSSFRVNDGTKSSGGLNNYMWHLTNCKATGLTTVDFLYVYQKQDSNYVTQWGGGVYDVAEAVSSIQLVSTSGDSFTAGDYNVYGG